VSIGIEYIMDSYDREEFVLIGNTFVLKNKTNACLAKDDCGISTEKQNRSLSELTVNQSNSCTPNSGCC